MALRSNKSSDFIGVHYNKSRCVFQSQIVIDGISKFIGSFNDDILAAMSYDQFITNNNLKRRLNFPVHNPESVIPNTKLIILNGDYFAIVDDEDFERVNQYTWSVNVTKTNTYARRYDYSSGVRVEVKMHKFILGVSDDIVDHKNNDGLHNYKSNLRIATKQQNNFNCRNRIGCSSRFKGVSWHKGIGKFFAYIGHNYKRINIGYFTDEVEAAMAYNRKAIELFGEFARLNEIKT